MNEKKPKETPPVDRKWEAYELLHDMIYILAAVLVIFVFLVRMVTVKGPSMLSTLVDGDRLTLLSNTLYLEPRQGDVIVASVPTYNDGEAIVKRVIATAGQEVDIRHEGGVGTVYVDGEALEEPYINEPMQPTSYTPIEFPVTIPEDCVFVMGDNRNHSADSRYPEIGIFDKNYVMGKVLMVVWPGRKDESDKRQFGRIGVVHGWQS